MKTIDSQNVPQIIYYQAGVGTGDSLYDQLIGGGTGLGLAEHIREAYGFLTNNYMPGDQIFLIGFSRGAFTARSIAGLISLVGICTKQGMESFYTIFKVCQADQTQARCSSRSRTMRTMMIRPTKLRESFRSKTDLISRILPI